MNLLSLSMDVLLLFSTMYLSFMDVVMSISGSFFFILSYGYTSQLVIRSSADGYLGYLFSWVIMNKIAIDILIQVLM